MVYHRILDLTMDDEAGRTIRDEQRKCEYAVMAENMANNFFRVIGIPVNLIGYAQPPQIHTFTVWKTAFIR